MSRLMMSQADFDDIAHRLPFVLTTPELPQYDLTYLGRQRVDDIDTYVFDCKPKVIEKNKRYFQGKVWVDQQQFEIVLINGKSVPDILKRGHEDLSPPYTTYYLRWTAATGSRSIPRPMAPSTSPRNRARWRRMSISATS